MRDGSQLIGWGMAGGVWEAMQMKASAKARIDAEGNAISVRVELMADCLAGVWAYHAARQFGTIERGDVAEAMKGGCTCGS